MSQRLVARGPISRIHPRTGGFIEPLGWTLRGLPIWPIMGAAEGDDKGTGDGKAAEGAASGDGKAPDDKGDGGKEPDVVPKVDFENVKTRMQAADRRASEEATKREALEKRLQEIEDKDLSEQEKAAKRVPDLENRLSRLEQVNKDLALENAFLKVSTITWHDPAIALKQTDLSGVRIGEDGTVDANALKEALKATARAYPFLVKKDDDKGGNEGGGDRGSTGSAFNGDKNNRGTGEADEKAVVARFPALARRR